MWILISIVGILALGWYMLGKIGDKWAREGYRLDEKRFRSLSKNLAFGGTDGAGFNVLHENTGDSITIIKCREEPNWQYDVTVKRGSPASQPWAKKCSARLRVAASGIEIVVDTGASLRFRIPKTLACDDELVQRICRIVCEELGHPSDSRYQVEGSGYIDMDKLYRHYGLESSKWRPRGIHKFGKSGGKTRPPGSDLSN